MLVKFSINLKPMQWQMLLNFKETDITKKINKLKNT